MPRRKKLPAEPAKISPSADTNESEIETESSIRARILARAKTLTLKIQPRLSVVVANLEGGHHIEALAVLFDIESQITQIRSILSFLEQE
jgi:hypothetical protein